MNAAVLVLAMVAVVRCDTRSEGVAPWVTLNDGRRMPSFGLGTWLGVSSTGERHKPHGDEVTRAVEWAIDAGYRHIDTAAIYDTESQVGRAINKKISEGVVKRSDLFVTTKLWNDAHAREAVLPALRRSLDKLRLDYVDLYLIHWPLGQYANGTWDDTDYVETWSGLVAARELGLARSVGVSNFNRLQLDRLLALTHHKPAVLQVEINLSLQQPELLAFCREHDIFVTAYTPFGSIFPFKAALNAPPPRVDDPALLKMADKYNKTVPQIVLRYLVELGTIPIPKSVTQERILQNIQVFDFQLTKQERDVLKAFDVNYRTIHPTFWEDSIHYPFEKTSKKTR